LTRPFILAAIAIALLVPRQAAGLEQLCDPAHEDCRAPLLDLIERETVGIDVAFWFMEDLRYSSALMRAQSRGVPIRVLMDTRANVNYPGNIPALDALQRAGIPMREKTGPGILHWKMMLFAGQRTVQFSGANYSGEAFVPHIAWSSYVDEVIYFTDRPSYVNSFMTKFDDIWTETTGFRNYANVTSPQRAYPTSPIDPELNFPPGGFRERSVARYAAETQRIDAIMYRITDRAHTDALIAAMQRGVPVRVFTEQLQYREETRLWHAWNVDRLWAAGQRQLIGGEPGIQVRHRRHDGLGHEKLTVLRGLGMAIFGSSNWTSPSSDTQLEHNLFTTDPTIYGWSRDHFDRKWFNTAPSPETQPFVPLPPHVPQLVQPARGEINVALPTVLMWNAGPWAHKYDIFLGTDPNNLPKIVSDKELGPYSRSWEVTDLRPGTTYYWRVVSRTMADVSRSSTTCSFRTAGSGDGPAPAATCLPGPPNPADPVAVEGPQDVGRGPLAPTTPPTPTSPAAPGTDALLPAPARSVTGRRTPEGAVYTGTVAVPRP
jgi:phosphatidylserine/phosphatidylglycerophosphate/cardiolipin synthase-like enzyme